MIKKTFIIYGPSGIGKSTISKMICKQYDYKHCNTDAFKFIFSSKRSKARTEIGEYLAYTYAVELIKRKYNIIIEALSDSYLSKLRTLLRKNNYEVIEISLKAPVEQCIKNDKNRSNKAYGKKIISEVYKDLCFKRGDIIDVTNLSIKQIYDIFEEKYFK